jgi:hypothetical protein
MDRFQKEWSDILGKMVWFSPAGSHRTASGSHHGASSSHRNRPEPSHRNRLDLSSGQPTRAASKGGIPENQANIRKILRLKGTKKNRYYVQLTYIIENIAYKSGFDHTPFIEYLDSIEWNENISDVQIYAKLRAIHRELTSVVAAEPYHRGETVSQKMVKYLSQAGVESIERYLDYGCGPCEMIKAVGMEFGAKEENSYGVDIVQYKHPAPANFGIIKDNKIPHPDDFFDLITVSYVLHHIPDKNIAECIQEMYRTLSPMGTLIIREHTVLPNEITEMTINLDFMHDIYSEVLTSEHSAPWKSTDLYYAKYRSSDSWDELMKVPGFILNAFQPRFNPDIASNPLRATVRIYNKNPIVSRPLKLFRTITDKSPRAPYKRRRSEFKTTNHWGQRKLLLSEIEFLTLFYKSDIYKANTNKSVYVVYAGAAPGIHIKYLAKLFPRVHFELYDPREFSRILENHTHIKMHRALFLEEDAESWSSKTHPDSHMLLVSDIRTASPYTMSMEESEEHIASDNALQKSWWEKMRPAMAMFKFRLPWDDASTLYPSGDIHLGVFVGPTSSETRLIINSPDAPMKSYDNAKYEGQLFRFNSVERLRPYENILFDVPSEQKDGLDNRYDSAAEIHIIQSYLEHFTRPRDIREEIIKVSKIISKVLSRTRTLRDMKPMGPGGRMIVERMKELGVVPADAPVDRLTRFTYISKNYNDLVSRGILPPREERKLSESP